MAVWVTRPAESGEQLVERLTQEGIFALHLPLFQIEAGRELNHLPQKLAQLKANDYVFVVSKNAVYYAEQTLKQVGLSWRKDLCYFAVGKSSAEYFSQQSESAVIFPLQQENSEGVLALPEMQQLTEKNILILRGNGGREFFSQQAQLRGANVDIIECYQRIPMEYDNEEQISLFQRVGIDKIVVTSTEILHSLIDFVPKKDHNWLKDCQLITISERIATLAQQMGWQKIKISAQADNNSILTTLRSN